MTDTTHNTLVTLMIIIGIVIAIILLGRGFGNNRLYTYQPASAIRLYSTPMMQSRPLYYGQSVTSYSRPSRYTTYDDASYNSNTTQYQYETTTYTCPPTMRCYPY